MKNLKKRSTWRVAFLAVAILALTNAVALQMPSRAFSAIRAQSQSKEDLIRRLTELGVTIAILKEQLAIDPKNEDLIEQIDSAIAEYDSISAKLGGDRAPISNKAASLVSHSGLLVGAPQDTGALVAPSPPGCAAPTITTASNSTPVDIPEEPGPVASSTIDIAGAGPFIWDVDVTVNITHTFPGDLDMTLMSPSGKIVTLSTDNGGSNDNVFAGTTFDDQANPGGQVPYTTNAGLVGDHPYANLTVATPLAPEEALALFNGDDPNGTWTLTIDDDAGGDTGTLNSWSLSIATLPSAPVNAAPVNASNMTPVDIPDEPGPVASSTINISSPGTFISDVNVTVNITHTFNGDLDMTLMSPSGKIVTLSTDNGGSNDNVFAGTTFDDQANPGGQVPYATNAGLVGDHPYANLTVATPLAPEEALALFNGDDPNGTWTLTIDDDAGGDTGTLNSWSLSITTAVCACALTCPADIVVSGSTQCGVTTATVNYPAPTATGACGTITCTPPSGSAFPSGTTTVTCTDSASMTSCSFTVTVADVCLQDDSNRNNVLVLQSGTGAYRFCCGSTTFTGTGIVTVKGCTITLQDYRTDRRVLATIDKATSRGTASLQSPPGRIKCTITDRDIRNNTCNCM